jgi:hypothetical protein
MIKDLKELKALFQLCRKQGVTDITLGDLHIKFGDLPYEANPVAEQTQLPDELTPEQLMYYSVGGLEGALES